MSRRTYCNVLQHYHARLYSTGKRLSPRAAVMHHSDGSVFDLLPDMMDAGVEVLEAVQVGAAHLQPESLKEAYGDRLCFHGGISVQSLLPHCVEATVFEEVCRLISVFGKGGVYIAAPAHAIQVGTPPRNVMAMLHAVMGNGLDEVLERSGV